jgi:hypothetical protein
VLEGNGGIVSDEFAETMGLLDRLSIKEKVDLLTKNADAVAKGMD